MEAMTSWRATERKHGSRVAWQRRWHLANDMKEQTQAHRWLRKHSVQRHQPGWGRDAGASHLGKDGDAEEAGVEGTDQQWPKRTHKADCEALDHGENFPVSLALHLIQAVTSNLTWLPGDLSTGFMLGWNRLRGRAAGFSSPCQAQLVSVSGSEESVCSLVLCTRA